MILKKWDSLPSEMKNEEVRYYYDILKDKKASLVLKRIFDIVVSAIMLILLSPVFLILAVVIKSESKGPVFYKQVRLTSYCKEFKIFKFRTMVQNADKIGAHVTTQRDSRITKSGAFIRRYRLDEISQLINVFTGSMTFVGTRPEVPEYVEHYTPEMYATFLLPAGVTSLTSIYYKDEGELLKNSEDPNDTYIKEVLPGKMLYNLKGIEKFGFWGDIKIMFMTFFAMCGKEYNADIAVSEKTESVEEINV